MSFYSHSVSTNPCLTPVFTKPSFDSELKSNGLKSEDCHNMLNTKLNSIFKLTFSLT